MPKFDPKLYVEILDFATIIHHLDLEITEWWVEDAIPAIWNIPQAERIGQIMALVIEFNHTAKRIEIQVAHTPYDIRGAFLNVWDKVYKQFLNAETMQRELNRYKDIGRPQLPVD